jgi:hypothetical protein
MAIKKSTISAIETELREVTGLKPGAKEKRQAFLKKLAAKVNDMSDEDKDKTYDGLTGLAQDWINAANAAMKKDQDYPDFDWQDPVDTEKPNVITEDVVFGEESEPEMPAKKTAKKAAVKKVAAPKKAKVPVVKAAKVAKVAKPKTNGAAKKASNGKSASYETGTKSVSAPWKAIFKAIAKKGDAGMPVAGIAAECEKNDVKLHYARFCRAGYLARAERGHYKITASGKKAADI